MIIYIKSECPICDKSMYRWLTASCSENGTYIMQIDMLEQIDWFCCNCNKTFNFDDIKLIDIEDL